MSLYHEAAQILSTAIENGGSIKSIVFGRKDWRSEPKTLFALSTEAAKWSEVLAEVVEKSGLLKSEKQLTPTLALLLIRDHLLSKNGVALPQTHGLHAAIARHRSRLAAELTKVRLSRGCATVDALRDYVNNSARNASISGDGDDSFSFRQPRWIRINTILTSLDEQLNSTFQDYVRTEDLAQVARSISERKLLYIDEHIPDLIALSPRIDLTSSRAYKQGKLILQDKASCFPAYLLDPESIKGDVIDACAAPGNKTTHVAALLPSASSDLQTSTHERKLFACEKDASRSETLAKMVNLAGAGELVRIKAKQDFMKLDPSAKEFSNVTALLLDPSCSGSGIVGRDEVSVKIHLPRHEQPVTLASKSKKRKRAGDIGTPATLPSNDTAAVADEESPIDPALADSKLQARLEALSSFQLRLLKHAMAFPTATRITYSTCSIHDQENEHVVVKALMSEVAVARGWRILQREEQVVGLKKWHIRGGPDAVQSIFAEASETGIIMDALTAADGCIRCEKGTPDGTMGFFVAGFVRDSDVNDMRTATNGMHEEENDENHELDEEWSGFGDDET